MLRTRVITAVIVAPLAIAAIYLLPLGWYAIFYGAVAALGAWEWAGLVGLEGATRRLAYVSAFVALAVVTWLAQPLYAVGLWAGVVVWLAATAVVFAYPRGSALLANRWLGGALGLVVVWAAWIALVVIRADPGGNGANWVLWLLFLVWAADVGAYFAGRRFGRVKLAQAVSPGKTWEGALGGLLLSLLLCGGAALAAGLSAWWLLVVAALVAVSVIGDLFESVLKRVRGVKDSGTLLPGHGGVLDRIDSVLAALPVFALILSR